MPRGDNGPRFVHEFELTPTPQQARLLGIRLDLARQMYNALLGEAWRRLKRCRRDRRWREARMLRTTGQTHDAQALYAAVKRTYGFSAYALTGMVKVYRTAHFHDHLDFKSCQAMAQRAQRTVDRLLFDSQAQHVTFLPKGERKAVDSISIHWRGHAIAWNSPAHKLIIPVRFDQKDTQGVEAYALAQM
jgi:putative transposase